MLDKAIVYPIKDGNKKDSNIELMFSIRSLCKHLIDPPPIFVLSESRPDIISSQVNFIEVSSYEHAVETSCSIAKEILWFNDDIFLLRDHTWDDFRRWVLHRQQKTDASIDSMVKSKNGWTSKKGQVMKKLKELGKTTYDFSSHTPYLYDTCKLKEVFGIFNFGYKTAFETAYGNYNNVCIRKCNKLQRYHKEVLPVDMSFYDIMNYNDVGTTDHIRGFLLGRFSEPSIFESHGIKDLTKKLLSEIK